MPCGGIRHKDLMPKSYFSGKTPCTVCARPDSELFVEEWDSFLHIKCLGTYLQTEAGSLVLKHKHEIQIPEGHQYPDTGGRGE